MDVVRAGGLTCYARNAVKHFAQIIFRDSSSRFVFSGIVCSQTAGLTQTGYPDVEFKLYDGSLFVPRARFSATSGRLKMRQMRRNIGQ